MIKLKSLLIEQEQENKYPEDAPEHFGGGKNIDIFGLYKHEYYNKQEDFQFKVGLGVKLWN